MNTSNRFKVFIKKKVIVPIPLLSESDFGKPKMSFVTLIPDSEVVIKDSDLLRNKWFEYAICKGYLRRIS
jgi:hypothetical protein